MTWRITGTEQLRGDDPRAPWEGRRADISWNYGLVVAPGSEWILAKLRELEGQRVFLGGSAGTPVITVGLGDRAAAYWSVVSCLYDYESAGDEPAPTWRDDTPSEVPN